ncbi:hypothetical protein GCM10023093_01920 [Nemorincola caseinilytica]|uniref:BIG2 domain-containing protein n=1 Tax=Nemorincola caseinilytica TaxID=2054315 RepID=A0ABP8N4Z7_9BACT
MMAATSIAQTAISPTTWGGTTLNAAAGPSAYAPLPASTSPGTAAVNVSQWDRGPGVSYNAGANRYNSAGWTVGASAALTVYSAGDYIYFTVTNNSTTQLKITGVGVGAGQSSSTGPNTFGLVYRIGSGAATVFGSTASGASPSFSQPAGVVVCGGQTITFYLCGWGGSGASGTWSINNTASITAQWITAVNTTASNTSPVPAGTSFNLNSSPSGGVTPYSYSWAGPSYSSTAANPTVTSPTTAASGNYTLTVTDAWGCTKQAVTTATVNPAAVCSGTPTAGTAAAAPASHCASGSSTISLTGSSSASGISYQWISSTISPAGPYTIIGSATSPTYSTGTISTTTYYRCILTCTSTTDFDTSSVATVTINPLPTVSVGSGNVCSGGSGLSITATGATTFSWAPSTGLSATTGATVTANPTTTTVYTVTGTTAGCSSTATSTVTYVYTPGAVTVSPTSIAACAGDATRLIRATGGVTGPMTNTVNSGTITIPGTVGAFGTITANLNMSGIPAGAVITGAAVNVISFGSNYQDDYVINIKAPNGNILNLVNQRGAHGPASAAIIFTNTNISSAGTTSLATGSGVFTGTWRADAGLPVGAAPYVSNVNAWNDLYSTPNGTWTLSLYNNTGFTNNLITSAAWSITLNYTVVSPITWSPSANLYSDAAATIPYTGAVTDSVYFNPATAGTTTVVATASNSGCTRTGTATVTVNPLPGPITGADTVCIGQTVTLSNTITGGTWTASNGNVAFAPGTADMTGVTAGTATVTYTLPNSCYTTTTVTVNTLPAAITGPTNVCEGANITLGNTTTPGTWSSSNSNATADVASGIVTGNTAGTATISYTLGTGCYSTYTITVDQAPASITGPTEVCIGSNVTLANTITPGTWSSIANITIDGTTGVATGNTAGTATITYTLPTTCYTTRTMTVNSLPAGITAGTGHVCENGGTLALSNSIAGGRWSTSNTNISIDGTTGLATGAAAGTSVVTYTLGTGCYVTTIVTVDAAPAIITGTTIVCEAGTITMLNATGTGTWSTTSANVAIGATTGVVTGLHAGTATISYSIPNGCYVTESILVNPQPAPITGLASVCLGATIPLTGSGSGTWSSSNADVSVDIATGDATGMAVGSSTITYTLSGTGCYITRGVSVNPLPVAITGATSVCEGSTATVLNTGGGGTWASGNTAIATVNSTTGVVSGHTAGTVAISYILLGTGCSTSTIFTVNPTPPTSAGPLSVCTGGTITLTNSTGSGVWSTGNASVATVDPTGLVTAIGLGPVNISYTLPATGCYTSSSVTVTATPSAITGSLQVCVGISTPLSNPMPGGTWSSSNTAIGSINVTSGVVTGVTPGTVSITYSLLTGCSIATTVTVTDLPPAITGTSQFCAGTSVLLMNTVTGGTWSAGAPATATVAPVTGAVTGVSAGTALVSYTTGTGCIVTKTVTIDPMPTPITGVFSVCEGRSTTLSSATPGGVWVSNNTTIANVDAAGVVNGVAAGITYITYTLGTTCSTHATITVNAIPATISGGNICIGSGAAFASTSAGGTWTSSNTAIATISASGVAFGTALGTATISYTFANGCYNTTTATVQPLPAAYNVTGGGNYCTGGTGVNIGLATSQTGVDYALYTGGAPSGTETGTGTGISFGLQTAPGVYTVQATNATTGCQRTMTGSAMVIAQPLVTPAVTLLASVPTDTSCSGAAVVFSPAPVNGGTAPVYNWYLNGVATGTGATYSVAPAHGDIVSIKMTSNAACRTVDTAVAGSIRNVLPSLHPAAGLVLSPASTTVCVGTVVTLTATPVGGGAAPGYVWLVNGTSVGTGATYSFLPSDNDRVKCIITSNYRCRTGDTAHSAEVEMNVIPPTLPMVTINATPGNTIAAGELCSFSAVVTNAGPTPGYQWAVNATDIAGATNSTYSTSALQNGDVVTCLVSSSGICNGITNYNAVVMTVVTPGNVAQTTASSTIRLMPNPNNGAFTISGIPTEMAEEEMTISITNMLGQRVYENTLNTGNQQVTIEMNNALPNGMYIVNLRTSTQHHSINFVMKH